MGTSAPHKRKKKRGGATEKTIGKQNLSRDDYSETVGPLPVWSPGLEVGRVGSAASGQRYRMLCADGCLLLETSALMSEARPASSRGLLGVDGIFHRRIAAQPGSAVPPRPLLDLPPERMGNATGM